MASDELDGLITSLSVRAHAFAVCAIKSGHRLGFDPIDGVTIHYVLAGTGTIRAVGGACAAYGPCSVIVVPAGVEQSLGDDDATVFEVASDNNCGLLGNGLVTFTAGDGARDTLVVCATIGATYGGALGVFDGLRRPLVEDFAEGDDLRDVFARLTREIANPALGTQALVESLMKQVLVLLLRRQLADGTTDSPLLPRSRDQRLSRAVTAVMERPASGYTVDTLAAIAGMSRSTFAERFSRTFNLTPMDFVAQVRLRLAAELLRNTDLPIKVIAASVGYNSPAYFSRAFKDAHDLDPKSFRDRATRGLATVYGASRPTLAERVAYGVERAVEG